jgi:hypothetical protein
MASTSGKILSDIWAVEVHNFTRRTPPLVPPIFAMGASFPIDFLKERDAALHPGNGGT